MLLSVFTSTSEKTGKTVVNTIVPLKDSDLLCFAKHRLNEKALHLKLGWRKRIHDWAFLVAVSSQGRFKDARRGLRPGADIATNSSQFLDESELKSSI